jgi:histidine triad (HIT) family protein
MQLSPEQHKAIEQQKEQCIFCQIVAGKIPSKKVYEDNLVLGILDINPASKGHVLMMPKEHYPIMPIIPQETFKHLIDKMKDVDRCVKEATLCKETTIFIANGGAAGQQSSHFMLHIIPREGKDGLEMLDLKGKLDEKESAAVTEKIGQQLKASLERNLAALGYTKQLPPQRATKEQLIQIIESNPQLKEMMLNNTDQFRQLVKEHAQLRQLFNDFKVEELVSAIKTKQKPKSGGKISIDESIK